MGAPVYDGMPPTDRVFSVPRTFGPTKADWGRIRCGGPCQDDYKRIQHFTDQGGRIITLQAAAMRSFREAESALGKPIRCTGTARACSLQTQLHAQDPERFAPASASAHCRALAIDVDTSQSQRFQRGIRKALEARGWHQARADDEPWHYSFGIKV